MDFSYLHRIGAQAVLTAENKKIAKRRSYLNRGFTDMFRLPKIYKLAEECFFSEYIWEFGEDEAKRVEDLLAKVKDGRINDPSDLAYFIPVIACYKPLYKTDIADIALEQQGKIKSPVYEQLLKYSILQPREEEKIKADIPVLGDIQDPVSKQVKQQYEENPYPRWKYRPSTVQATASEVPLDILIAGCGSGSPAIYAAMEQPNSKITAIDLSVSSLAYGKRIAEKLGLENIDFICCDILNVKKLEQEFDYIHSTGVLHHMSDPMKGWKELTNILRSGGIMSIGLYSYTAREAVRLAREYLKENDIEYSPEELRKFREHVKKLPTDDPMVRLALMGDFYSLSECRDMLFHVQEHQFTIPQISEALDKFELEFLGFQKKDNRIDKFYQRHPNAEDHTNLELWAKFEQDHPLTFLGMYLFTCRKNEQPSET